jgi:large conductance mechanosensitive channel
MKGFLDEFKKFIMRGNVVDLAVGIIIGAAFGDIVKSLVADVFMPIIGLITGGFDVSRETIDYKDTKIGWGKFVQSMITFVIVGFCLFLVVKGMNRLKELHGVEPPPPAPEPTATEKLLAEIRDLLQKQAPTPSTSDSAASPPS